jgi:Protein of unknown function (DUF3293)
MNPDLHTAYLATEFRIAANTPFSLFIQRRSNPLLMLMAEHGARFAAYITAYNPHSVLRADEKNHLAYHSLRQHIGSAAVALFDAVGVDPSGKWQGEPGFLILGIELEDAKRIGVHFHQNAIVRQAWTRCRSL